MDTHAGSPTENGRCSRHTCPLSSYCRRAAIALSVTCETASVSFRPEQIRNPSAAARAYLGRVRRSLANAAGLHLSLAAADLPSLQASVDTEDLQTITSVRNPNAAASLASFCLETILKLSSSFFVYGKVAAAGWKPCHRRSNERVEPSRLGVLGLHT